MWIFQLLCARHIREMTSKFLDLTSYEMNVESIKNIAKQLGHSRTRLAWNSECYQKHFVLDHRVIASSRQTSLATFFPWAGSYSGDQFNWTDSNNFCFFWGRMQMCKIRLWLNAWQLGKGLNWLNADSQKFSQSFHWKILSLL